MCLSRFLNIKIFPGEDPRTPLLLGHNICDIKYLTNFLSAGSPFSNINILLLVGGVYVYYITF